MKNVILILMLLMSTKAFAEKTLNISCDGRGGTEFISFITIVNDSEASGTLDRFAIANGKTLADGKTTQLRFSDDVISSPMDIHYSIGDDMVMTYTFLNAEAQLKTIKLEIQGNALKEAQENDAFFPAIITVTNQKDDSEKSLTRMAICSIQVNGA